MNHPRITIITPSFNQGRFLERTILSVIEQDYDNLEYLIADGGSTDESVAIIQRHEDRIDWWVSEPDGGQPQAINKALARATGNIIAFINSDDMYVPGALNEVARQFTEISNTDWLIGGCRQIDAADAILGRWAHHCPQTLAGYLARQDGMLPQPSSFWSKRVFEKLGGFDETLQCCFDREYNCRLLANGFSPRMIEKDLSAFRIHGESKGTTMDVRFGQDRIKVIAKYLPHVDRAARARLRKLMGYNERTYAIQEACLEGNTPLIWRVARRPWWLGSQQIRSALIEQLKGSETKGATL